tara:strand:- start:59 stop:784 length:726 start_codon:yes stop_codon:yes gene_type:complete
MRLNYNFAFKNSKLREWQKPKPPNLLLTNVSLRKKFTFIFNGFNNNSELFYPPSLIILITVFCHLFTLYPNSLLKKLEPQHNKYSLYVRKLSNLNSTKNNIKDKLNKIDKYFSESTTSYLFAYYLQNSIPKGVQLNSYSFSDNGFDIKAKSFSLDTLNQFLTLLIESPVVDKQSVTVDNIKRFESNIDSKLKTVSNYEIEIYGRIVKLDDSQREDLYYEADASGLFQKLKRFKHLKLLLKS